MTAPDPAAVAQAADGINITDGIPSEIFIAIGRGRYDDDGLYDLAKDCCDAMRLAAQPPAEVVALARRVIDEYDEVAARKLAKHILSRVEDRHAGN